MLYDVFISFKNSDENGKRTIDSEIAKKLYEFLTKKGLRVFFSNIELEFTGKSQYSKIINEALDSSRFLIAVGSSNKNLNSEWVNYEWDSFLNDIRSGIKPNAEVFVLRSGMQISELPRALRQQQSFDADEKDSFENLYRFIKNALGTTAPPISEPLPKAPVAKEVKPTAKQPLAPKSKRLLAIALSLALVVGLVFGGIALWGKRAGTDSVTNGNSILHKTTNNPQDPLTYDEGIVINGVKWATRNVDKPGTFAAKPEDTGMFYQWNSKIGWSATDPMVNSDGGTIWDDILSEDTIWEKPNDPSPVGWRVPTFNEFKTLLDTTKVNREWITENGVSGWEFTERTSRNSIFLPTTAFRNGGSDGGKISFEFVDYGYYWSSSSLERRDVPAFRNSANYLHFWNGYADINESYKNRGMTIRSIAN